MSDSGISRHQYQSGLSTLRRPRSASETIRRRVNQLLGRNAEPVEHFHHMRHAHSGPDTRNSTASTSLSRGSHASRRKKHLRAENKSADSGLGISNFSSSIELLYLNPSVRNFSVLPRDWENILNQTPIPSTSRVWAAWWEQRRIGVQWVNCGCRVWQDAEGNWVLEGSFARK